MGRQGGGKEMRKREGEMTSNNSSQHGYELQHMQCGLKPVKILTNPVHILIELLEIVIETDDRSPQRRGKTDNGGHPGGVEV